MPRNLYPFQQWVGARDTPALMYLLLAIKYELVARGLAYDLRVRLKPREGIRGVPQWLLRELMEEFADAVECGIERA